MNEKQTHISLFTVLLLVAGLSIPSIWWILSNVIWWSDGKHTEYLLIPLVLGLLLTMLELELCKRKNPWDFVITQLIVGIIGIICVDIIIYLSLNALGPTWLNFQNPNYVNSTRWLSGDEYLMMLFGLWFLFQFICIFPSIACILLYQGKDFGDYQTPWHVSWIILGTLMGIRIGGSWSGIYYHCIYLLILFPVLVYLLTGYKFKPTEGVLYSIPLLPLLAILFLCGFWYALIEAQQAPSQFGNYYWFVPAILHLIALLLFKPASQENGNRWLVSKKFLLSVIWLIGNIGIILLFLMNLFTFFSSTRSIWLIMAMLGGGVAAEILAILTQAKQNKLLLWSLLGMIAMFLGIIFPYGPNAYDPISSYAAIGLIGLNIVMILPYILKIQAVVDP